MLQGTKISAKHVKIKESKRRMHKMSVRIVEKKVDDGQLVGYLLEQEGLRFIVELRDLYEQEILEGLIASGYQYHDYYGDITSADGISINELTSSNITPEDNLSFKGEFAKDALTEQQALRYFRTNMSNIIQIHFREPWKIIIHNREELISYLKRWKYVSNTRTTMQDLYPLNAICAKEALFTPEEIETDSNIREAFIWMENRRRYPTYETLQQIKQFFVNEGLLKEEELNNPDAFIAAYCAWGPEGINATCIYQKVEYDVIYPIAVPYTGTGREKLTFDSMKAALRADLKDDNLSQINYRLSLGIMDKEGNIMSGSSKVDRGDTVENEGDILLSHDMRAKYNELSRSVGKWETPYRALKVIEVLHLNRMVLTLQTDDGRLYEWRMDKANIAFVSTNTAIFVQSVGTVKSIEGDHVLVDRFLLDDGYAKYTMFHRIASELIDMKRKRPAYLSTSELCLQNGLHAEQALDYIQFMSGREEATSILHEGVDELFVKKFGVEDADSDIDFIDMLEIMSTNYNDALTAEGSAHFDYTEVLSNVLDGNISQEDKKLAMYINNHHPIEKINAILDFSSNKIALDQAKGRSFDNSNSNEERVYHALITLYEIINGSSIDATKLDGFVQGILTEELIKVDDMVSDLTAEAHGCLADYASLKTKQIREVDSSIWVTGIIGEYSAAPIEERRHIGLTGVKMNLEKGSKMRKLVDHLLKSVEEQMITSGLYAEKDQLVYGRILSSHILEFLWGIKLGNINLQQENNMFSKTYEQQTKYTMKVKATFTIGVDDYYYIKSPNCKEFTYALTTLATYCRNSIVTVANSYRFNSMLMNVNINPWMVSKREGFEDILVYNGCLNLINGNQWEGYFKTSMPDVYNSVASVQGRVQVNPYDYDNTYAIYPVTEVESTQAGYLFSQINEEHGRTGNDLPPELINYYLENSFNESFRRYMQRINNSIKLISDNHAGQKKFYRAPIKSDYFYKNIASYYGIETVDDIETAEMDFLGVASKPHAPVFTNQRELNLISTGKDMLRVANIDECNITVDKLLRCNGLVKNGFSPRFDCYVGLNNIFVLDKAKTVLFLDKMTVEDMIKYASVGMCYQLSAKEFLFYGVNGTFVVEAN